MTTPENLGFKKPTGDDYLRFGDDAISQNADASAAMFDRINRDYAPLIGLVDDLTDAKWYRGNVSAGGEVDSLRGTAKQGRYRINSTSVTGLPGPWIGTLDVMPNGADGRTIQTFTRSAPGSLKQFYRVYSAGNWGAWNPSTWFAGLLTIGTDFDTLLEPALYGIQATTHPKMPVSEVGTLEVLPSSGNVTHRFTERLPPFTVWMRAYGGSTWTQWAKQNTGGGGGTGATINGYSIPQRTDLDAQPTVEESKPATEIMSSLSVDRLRGWNANTSAFSQTTDEGKTWEPVKDKDDTNVFAGSTVESVLPLDNGEILVSCLRGNISRREIWVSTNMDNPDTRTFTKTKTARAQYIKFTSAWSLATHGPIVLANEYGPKTPEWVSNPIAAGDNARHTFLSLDYGRTWSTIFDLNAYLTDVQSHTSTDGQHLHGVAWDAYWDRIWVTFGDNLGGAGSNGIVYSDDLGETWETAHYFSGPSSPHQVVGIQPMPQCILFYGDMGPDVVRIDRAEGKHKAEGYQTPIAYQTPAGGKHLCQGFTRIKRLGDDAPALATFGAEGQAGPSFAIATMDGYTFKEIWRDDVNNPSGMGARSIVGPTLRGNVIISANDKKVPGKWSKITAPAPGY